MAGEWIKMRTGLVRDPRVITMADFLADQREFMDWISAPAKSVCQENAYSHVTRNVTVALCVTGLLVTWGAAREQGDRFGDDLVLEHCSLDALSTIAGVPKFGDALELVGWAEWASTTSIVLPKFFKDNETPDEKHKRQAAERQAKFRAKQAEESNVESNVTYNVTVTDRVEKSREEKRTSKATETIVSGPVDEKLVNGHPAESKFPNCPQQRIVALYRERFPGACHPRQWDGANAANLAARWRETCKRLDFTSEAAGFEYFETLFAAVGQSDFLMGRKQSPGRDPFKLRLAWIAKKANFEKIVEGYFS